MNVIIGAGPAGLYAAIKLKKAGLLNLVIFDPRAGEYTRPGHLNLDVFETAEEGIGQKFWDHKKIGHIKDLERHLYTEALRLGIPIHKKRFVDIKVEDAAEKGIIVADTEGMEEFIPTEYLFDCTGKSRTVLKAVNLFAEEPPFILETITEPATPHHLLAYINFGDEGNWNRVKAALDKPISLSTLSPLDYTQSLIKLRAHGWKEYCLPYCYGAYFGKGKVCLYTEAPANLAPENYDSWLRTVLECFIKPVHYKHLPHPKKPRLMGFSLEAKVLNRVAYKEDKLPSVIALGDAQIDFDPRLAHGIHDGMQRIDALFETLNISEGRICNFSPDKCLESIKDLLKEHKEDLFDQSAGQRMSFFTMLEAGKGIIQIALVLSNDALERDLIKGMLIEIEARQAVSEIRADFSLMYRALHQLKANTVAQYSNLAFSYWKNEHFPEAINAAEKALALSDRSNSLIIEKIIFDYIKYLCAKAHEPILSKPEEALNPWIQQAKELIGKYAYIISPINRSKLTLLIAEQEQLRSSRLRSSPFDELINPEAALSDNNLSTTSNPGSLRSPAIELSTPSSLPRSTDTPEEGISMALLTSASGLFKPEAPALAKEIKPDRCCSVS